MTDVEILRRTPIFAGASDAQLEMVVGVAHSQSVPAGAVILLEGDHGDSLYILCKGSVEVTKRLGIGASMPIKNLKEKVLVRLDAPQFFGEMGLLESAERSATVTALGECELLEITKDDFEQLVTADGNLGYIIVRNLAASLSARLRRADRDTVKLTIALSLALGNRS